VAIAGDLRLDPAAHAVSSGKTTVPLTPTEFRLLGALVGRHGETVRRRELIATGWPDGAIVHDNTLDVYLARLRRKLCELPTEATIGTVHGVGYKLE
jgi:two-component system response regulator MprA